ncbi:cardiolipin synthase [Pseudoflavonifractor sp. MSJ-37]|uniref:cardiolipin synthase n=1 Tax=Pseudoflavonifractor sp. MSJ-37 TaxID=2841531 RepID=UPI001C116D97|nr:cardiolipin synthase [Pseudoflavonifractor sp. MSJ-37]MBU5435050.1 cardiolipin synthase [Pseudoflavonifractor sp. MSJ-37]
MIGRILRRIGKALCHRVTVTLLLMGVQVALFLLVMTEFSEYFVYFYWLCIVLSVIAVLWIVGNRSDPGYKIAWIIPILLFPVFGGLIYLLLGGSRLSARQRRRMSVMETQMSGALDPDWKAEALRPFGQDAVNQSRYLEQYAHGPAYSNTEAVYFPLGDDLFPRMLEELEKAERYIFLEYFIIQEGTFWDAILEVLERKAAAGVDVRVIYDDIGSLFTLPVRYAEKLEARGIRCCAFNRMAPVLSLRLNNRDHRKLCIIDGHTGITGGINLADEYINAVVKYGHWKDTAILLRGEAVWSMTVMFLTMWDYIRGHEDLEQFRPASLPEIPAECGSYFVQPYTDSPLDGEPVGETVYLNLISKARQYVYLTTPYLIISDSVNTALCNAAKSGVDVRIITPHIPDKKVIFEVTRAHYEPLLEAGVKIYEYTPGFIHAKNFVVDDRYGTVGTVNMDYRSMFLHFEDGVWLCGAPCLGDIKADFLRTQAVSERITLERCRSHSGVRRLFRAVLRVLAPMM